MGATRKPRTALQQKRHDESDAKKSAVLDRVAEGVAGLVETENWAEWLRVQARFHRYSFGNVMLIMMQKPTATQVASFKTWKELGRFPHKGTGIYIWAPHEKWVTREDPETGEEKSRKETRFHLATVFDVADTFGYVATWAGGDADKARELIKAHADRIHGAAKKIIDAVAQASAGAKEMAAAA